MSQSLRCSFYTASPSPREKIDKNDEEIEAPEGVWIPVFTWGMRHRAQGSNFTSLCSFPPVIVPPSAFLFTEEVGWVFIHSRASLCKFTFHKSQSFSSVSEQEAEQDICIFFRNPANGFFIDRSTKVYTLCSSLSQGWKWHWAFNNTWWMQSSWNQRDAP